MKIHYKKTIEWEVGDVALYSDGTVSRQTRVVVLESNSHEIKVYMMDTQAMKSVPPARLSPIPNVTKETTWYEDVVVHSFISTISQSTLSE